MEFSALLTSAGINIGLCALFLSLYSVLRKQPHNYGVYFGRRLAEEKFRQQVDYFSLERLLPTAGWIVKAYWCTEEEIRRVAGLDSVVFLRLFIFRFFSILIYAPFSTAGISIFNHDLHRLIGSSFLLWTYLDT